MAVCHHHAAAVLPFCVAGKPIMPVFHLGATIGEETPLWDQHDEFGDTNLLVAKQRRRPFARARARPAFGRADAAATARPSSASVARSGCALDLLCAECRVSVARAHAWLGVAVVSRRDQEGSTCHINSAPGVDQDLGILLHAAEGERPLAAESHGEDGAPQAAVELRLASRCRRARRSGVDNMLTDRRAAGSLPILAGLFGLPRATSGSAMAADTRVPGRLRVGRLDVELSDRRRGRCGRPRQEHLGRVFPHAGAGEERRHRRRRLRPLSPLARGRRSPRRAAASRPIASRRRGRASCRRAPARSNRAGSISTIVWSTASWRAASRRGFASIIGTCRRRCRTQGGWVKRDIADKFADYARVVARRLGDRVKHWAMFNEPNVHALFGYGVGSHAPGVTGMPNLLAAIHHQNLAQGRALQALRAERADFRLGTVHLAAAGASVVATARPTTAPPRGSTRSGTALFSIRCSRATIRPLIAERFAPLIAAGDLATHQTAGRFPRRQLLRAGVRRRRAGKPVRRLVRRRACRDALHRHGLADRCRRSHRTC